MTKSLRVEDLALFGGEPAFTTTLHVGRPNIGNRHRSLERINDMLDQLVDILQAENVLARRYFYPGCHQIEPYRSYFPHAGLLLPETERLTQQVISLPTGTAVESDDIHQVGQIIRCVVERGAEIRSRLVNG